MQNSGGLQKLQFEAAVPAILPMRVLAYCVSLPAGDVQDGKIKHFENAGLRCYYSWVGDFSGDTQKTAEAALDFHRVNTRLFQEFPILPFRFPTVAESLEDLESQVAAQSVRLRDAIERIGGRVQMEITISSEEDSSAAANTGTEYLKRIRRREQRLQAAAEAVKRAGAGFVKAWKERTRDRQVRIVALVERGSQQAFSQDLTLIALPDGVECRVVGPWPPTEFIDE